MRCKGSIRIRVQESCRRVDVLMFVKVILTSEALRKISHGSRMSLYGSIKLEFKVCVCVFVCVAPNGF